MGAIRGATAVLAFGLELAMLAAFVFWGYELDRGLPGAALGIVVALAVAAVWGIWLAPRSGRRIRWPVRGLLEAVLFAIACGALIAAGRTDLGLGFAAAVVVRFVLGAIGGSDAAEG